MLCSSEKMVRVNVNGRRENSEVGWVILLNEKAPSLDTSSIFIWDTKKIYCNLTIILICLHVTMAVNVGGYKPGIGIE